MTGLPGCKVEIESSTPGTWYDISAYVLLPAEVSIERGRRDEEDAIDASYVRLELNNSDGRFTYGAAGYQIRTDQRLRIAFTVGGTSTQRFVGYVQDWPLTWLSPVGNYAKCAIVATDRLARLARRDAYSLVQSDTLANSPVAYYTLGEPADSVSAGDTSGAGAAPLTKAGSGAPLVFGDGIGPVDGLTALEVFGGEYLTNLAIILNQPWSLSVFFSTTTTNTVLLEDLGLVYIRTSPFGFLEAGPGLQDSGIIVTDGRVHHAGLTINAAGLCTLYLDGVQVDALTTGGARLVGLNVGRAANATLSHIGVFDYQLSAGQVAGIATAGLAPEADSTDARIARYATYAGIGPTERSLESGATRAVVAPVDSSKNLDAMQEVATTEGGVVFINGAGMLVFQGRNHRVLAATGAAKLTIAAEFVDADDVTVSADKQYLVNTITGTRPDGAVQSAQNTASVALYEQYPDTQTLLVTTDQEVLDSIQWQVYAYATPRPRVPVFTLDLMTLPQATVQAALALEIGDRVIITSLPSQSPLTTLDLIVEGWAESLRDDEWQMTFNTSPSALFRAWLLEDTTYGVLDSTTRLYY